MAESKQSNTHLVIQTAYLGDLLLSIPLIRRLALLFPDDRLALVCRQGFGDLFLRLGLVHEVFEVDKVGEKNWAGLKSQLKARTFAHVITVHESFRTATIVAGLKAKKKIGYHHWWNFWAFNERIKRPMELPEAVRQLVLLRSLDEKLKVELDRFQQKFSLKHLQHFVKPISQIDQGLLPEWASMTLPMTSQTWLAQKIKGDAEFRKAAENVVAVSKSIGLFDDPVAFLAPGSVWNTKKWTPEGYAELGRSLRRRGFNVCVIGAPEEASVCEQVASQIPRSQCLAGKFSLLETLLLMSKGRVLVANDSGAMHLGSVVGLPTVAIFGPTVLEYGYMPWQRRSVVVEKALSCRPCRKHGGPSCPISTHECMKSITEFDVMAAVETVLAAQ